MRGVGWLTARPTAPAPPAEDRIGGGGATESSCGLADLQAACFVDPPLRAPATARLRALSCRRREDAGGPVADTTRAAERHPARGSRAFGAVSAGARAGRLDWIGSAPHAGRGGLVLVHPKAASFFIPPPPEIQSRRRRRGAAYSAAGTCRFARGWAARNRNRKVTSSSAASRPP
ncbi:hypothetical protein GQ55_7G278300 [Panicum hallii var. hallii]|uniref:Uncharacterized protein n=1 Tax=Panicum hallii var. hallii TaxID=1504633 RepID=A0A2T7D021_9POAL|nr:hypothetical protein GQ55_7G278300 [Panicum hallii var. hallii]